jgi:hypothetical protein
MLRTSPVNSFRTWTVKMSNNSSTTRQRMTAKHVRSLSRFFLSVKGHFMPRRVPE